MVEDLKTSKIGQWYSKVKRMSSIDPTRDEKISVEEIEELSSEQQAEIIADRFAEISNMYQPLKKEDINIPSSENSKPCPLFEPFEIHDKIQKMKKKSSTVLGDVPWRIIKEFSIEISTPLSNIYNSSTLAGVWPKMWKHEYITPAPKVFPPISTDDLRKISKKSFENL